MKTGVYARISVDHDGNEEGVDRQVEAGIEACDHHGWDHAQYVDDDLSATFGGPRPSYERLIADVAEGRIKRIVVFHLSRLWRNRRERAEGIELLRRHSVSIVCVKGPSLDLSTAYGRALVGLLGEFDTLEVEIKSERQLLANMQRAKAGQPHGGARRAFGYERDGMTVIPAEARAIKDACGEVLAGVSLMEIARRWNALGFRTGRSGAPWKGTTVRLVLSNPRIAGIRAHQGVEVGPAVWAAIVAEPVYRAVLAYVAHPDRNTGGSSHSGRRLLTGVALCGVAGCGQTVNGGGAGRFGPLYRCPSQRHLARKASLVDAYVSDVVLALLSSPDAADLLVDSERPDVDALREQAATLRARIVAARREFAADDTVTPADLRDIMAGLRARLVAVEAAMADAGRVDLLGPLIGAVDIAAAWEAYGTDRQRAVIDTLMVVRIHPPGRGARVFDPATVEIHRK